MGGEFLCMIPFPFWIKHSVAAQQQYMIFHWFPNNVYIYLYTYIPFVFDNADEHVLSQKCIFFIVPFSMILDFNVHNSALCMFWIYLPSLKLTVRTWKWMVGIRSFPFGARPVFRCKLAVSFNSFWGESCIPESMKLVLWKFVFYFWNYWYIYIYYMYTARYIYIWYIYIYTLYTKTYQNRSILWVFWQYSTAWCFVFMLLKLFVYTRAFYDFFMANQSTGWVCLFPHSISVSFDFWFQSSSPARGKKGDVSLSWPFNGGLVTPIWLVLNPQPIAHLLVI